MDPVRLNSSDEYCSYLASFSNLAFLLSKSVFYHLFLTEMGDFVNMALRPLPAVRAGQIIRHFSGSYVCTRLIEGVGVFSMTLNVLFCFDCFDIQ